MRAHWKDITTDAQHWYGLAVQVDAENSAAPAAANTRSSLKPDLRLESGTNSRLQLMQGDTPLFWATLARGYEGVYLLKSFAEFASPVAPGTVDSAVVEKIKRLAPADRLPAWSRVFAQALTDNASSLIHPGLWLFTGVQASSGHRSFTSEQRGRAPHLQLWAIEDVAQTLQDDPVCFIDWFVHEPEKGKQDTNSLVNLRPAAPLDSGRLKWWRKKAREQALPPILVWYLDCLQAYVVVDGHIRLQAAILENQAPEFIIVCSAQKEESLKGDDAEERQQKVMASLLHPKRVAPTVMQINAVLNAAFDDRPEFRTRTRAWARIPSNAGWLSDVEAQLRLIGRLDALPGFAERC